MRQSTLVLAVFGIVLFAGCAGAPAAAPASSDEPAAAPSAAPDADTGSIVGLVVDEAVEPIAGAQVQLAQPPLSAATDPSGRFTINGVPPGAHELFVGALGYDSVGRKVTVAAGQVTDVTIGLESIQIKEGYHEMIPKKGFWTAAVATIVAVPNTGVANDEHRVIYEAKADLNTSVIEMTWKYSNAGQSTTPGAWWNNQVTPEKADAVNPGEVFGKAAPLRADFMPGVVNRADGYTGTTRKAFPESPYTHSMYFFPLGILTDETKPATGSSHSRGVGTSFQQGFEVYVTIFYNEGPPVGYTALPDA